MNRLSGLAFEGYEIHMGRTTPLSDQAGGFAILEDTYDETRQAKADGLCLWNIYGTYVHGIFDAEDIAAGVVRALCEQKGVDFDRISTVDMKSYKEQQYDLLADGLRNALDMERIYQILDQGME